MSNAAELLKLLQYLPLVYVLFRMGVLFHQNLCEQFRQHRLRSLDWGKFWLVLFVISAALGRVGWGLEQWTWYKNWNDMYPLALWLGHNIGFISNGGMIVSGLGAVLSLDDRLTLRYQFYIITALICIGVLAL